MTYKIIEETGGNAGLGQVTLRSKGVLVEDLPLDPMRMLVDINRRLDGFLDLLTQQNARMHYIEEKLDEVLHWIQPKPQSSADPLANERTAMGEMLARAIREVSR